MFAVRQKSDKPIQSRSSQLQERLVLPSWAQRSPKVPPANAAGADWPVAIALLISGLNPRDDEIHIPSPWLDVLAHRSGSFVSSRTRPAAEGHFVSLSQRVPRLRQDVEMVVVTYELQLDFAKVLGEGLFYGTSNTVAWCAQRMV